MSKPVTRKHLAKVLTVTKQSGVKRHFVLIGGRWYLNGSSDTSVPTKSKDGFWDDESLKAILEKRSFYTPPKRLPNTTKVVKPLYTFANGLLNKSSTEFRFET